MRFNYLLKCSEFIILNHRNALSKENHLISNCLEIVLLSHKIIFNRFKLFSGFSQDSENVKIIKISPTLIVSCHD